MSGNGFDIVQFDTPLPLFMGERQPLMSSRLLAGLSVDNLAWDRRSPQAVALAIAANQPEAWAFDFTGASQAYGQRTISPQLTIPRVDQPSPNTNPQLEAQFYIGAQPDPWFPE